jgi:2-polyprenyl-3-methyl-5-hydroxy-6-metoxy-1,4-benzoquinol methylase
MDCPNCHHQESNVVLTVKDYTVSGLFFDLHRCVQCGFIYTGNPPSKAEIGKYYKSDEYISHTDSSKGVFNKIYQLVRNFSIRQKASLISGYTKLNKGRILDYGCGTGSFLYQMKKNGWKVTGIEPDDIAQKKAAGLIDESVFSPDHLHALQEASFDAITLWHVLEHVHDLDLSLNAFKRILKTNGILVIAVPNNESFDAKHYKENWAAYDVPRHLYHFTPSSIEGILSKHGFRKIGMKPMWFDAFYVSLLSEKYKYGKMRLLSALAIAIISNLSAFLQPGKCSSQIYIYRSVLS